MRQVYEGFREGGQSENSLFSTLDPILFSSVLAFPFFQNLFLKCQVIFGSSTPKNNQTFQKKVEEVGKLVPSWNQLSYFDKALAGKNAFATGKKPTVVPHGLPMGIRYQEVTKKAILEGWRRMA